MGASIETPYESIADGRRKSHSKNYGEMNDSNIVYVVTKNNMSNPCNKQNNSDNHDRSAPTITKEELEKENAALKVEIAKLGNNLYTPSTVPSGSKEIMEVDREDRDQFSSSTPLKRSHTLELDPDEEAEIRRVSSQLVLDVDGAENKGVSFGVGVFFGVDTTLYYRSM